MAKPRFRFALGIALALVGAQVAQAQGFDIPDGFTSEIVRKSGLGPGKLSVLRVRPAEGSFSGFSQVDLAPLPDAVADPDEWLRARVTVSLEDALPDPHSVLDSADSPFADPAFDDIRAMLGRWVEGVAGLGEAPLEFCGPAVEYSNAFGSYREMRCTLPIGPFRKYVVMRLQEIGETWYYTRITTMNAERLPDLVAIADSFHAD